MDKILVPTDFSDNSKGSVQFAIRLAAKDEAPLVFMHIMNENENLEENKEKLEGFILSIYKEMELEPADVSFVVITGFKADIFILDYCEAHPEIKSICIATRGASKLNKALGTNASNLIEKSNVPVLVVPKDYEDKPLTGILYASDLLHLESELKLVVDYARQKGLSVEILHFTSPSTAELEANLSADLEAKFNYPLTISLVKNDDAHPLIKNLQVEIEKRQPSLVCLFTNTKRTFYERIFLGSLTKNISYRADVPLLTYRKENVH